MNAILPHTRADDTLLRGHQELIDLCELRRAQAIKRIVEMDVKREASRTSLSHAFVERSETLSVHV
jgi:hypothetical protein